MSDETKTGGEGGQKTPAVTTTEKVVIPDEFKAHVEKIVESRVAAITATKNTATKEADTLREENERLKQATKTEQERLLDATKQEWRTSELNPLKQRLDTQDEYFNTQANKLLESIPEESRPVGGFAGLPPMERFEALRSVVSMFSKESTTVGGPANPPSAGGKKVWKASELDRLAADPDWFKSNKDEIALARKENRILFGQ